MNTAETGGRIDLHVHTSASDGTYTPAEVVRLAAETGLRAIAITDHDTADGVAEAVEEGKRIGVEVIPGIEVSVEWQDLGVHILGYFIDPEAPSLRALLDWVHAERDRRNREIAAAMRADGIDISYDALQKRWPGTIIGRPHFAEVLTELGLAENVKDAFAKYLNKGMPYFRRRRYIDFQQGFDVILQAGGKPVFAHPLQYRLRQDLLVSLVHGVKEAGAAGMECYYTGYGPEQRDFLLRCAGMFGLCPTGGSDFHGANKPQIRLGSGAEGELCVDYALLEALKGQ